MKKYFIRTAAGIAVIASAVVLFSFTSRKSAISNSTKPTTGEGYYKAIFFSEGEWAQQIPVLKQAQDLLQRYGKLDAKMQAEQQQVQDEIVSIIKRQSPDFFDGFNKAMQSKSPLAIYDQLNQAYAVSKSAFLQYLKENKNISQAQLDLIEANSEKIRTLTERYAKKEIAYEEFHKALGELQLRTRADGTLPVDDTEITFVLPVNIVIAGNIYIYFNIQYYLNISYERYVTGPGEAATGAFSQFENKLTLEKFAKSIADHI